VVVGPRAGCAGRRGGGHAYEGVVFGAEHLGSGGTNPPPNPLPVNGEGEPDGEEEPVKAGG